MRIGRHRNDILVTCLLAAGLVGATWPAWRVLLLGDKPTFEELLLLVCSTEKKGESKPAKGEVTQPPPPGLQK
jgi:hypothetical protein